MLKPENQSEKNEKLNLINRDLNEENESPTPCFQKEQDKIGNPIAQMNFIQKLSPDKNQYQYVNAKDQQESISSGQKNKLIEKISSLGSQTCEIKINQNTKVVVIIQEEDASSVNEQLQEYQDINQSPDQEFNDQKDESQRIQIDSSFTVYKFDQEKKNMQEEVKDNIQLKDKKIYISQSPNIQPCTKLSSKLCNFQQLNTFDNFIDQQSIFNTKNILNFNSKYQQLQNQSKECPLAKQQISQSQQKFIDKINSDQKQFSNIIDREILQSLFTQPQTQCFVQKTFNLNNNQYTAYSFQNQRFNHYENFGNSQINLQKVQNMDDQDEKQKVSFSNEIFDAEKLQFPQFSPMKSQSYVQQPQQRNSQILFENQVIDQDQISKSKSYCNNPESILKANELNQKGMLSQFSQIQHHSKAIVSFVKIEKHQPSRKNIKNQLIWWNQQQTDDYLYSKYLEQNRYNRLFQEIEQVGQGGFGKVYKVQHVLDQRIYAIKKIKIHLGMQEDFKQHCVYREIIAISQVMHKNVVRYHACWIENVSPNESKINRAIKIIESDIKSKFKSRRAQAKKLEKEKSSNTDDSMLDPKKINQNRGNQNGYRQKEQPKNENRIQILGQKWAGKNLLKIIEDDSEMQMNQDWAYKNEISGEQSLSSDNIQSIKVNKIQQKNQSSNSSSSNDSSESSLSSESSKSDSKSSDEDSSGSDSEESQEEGSDDDESSAINSQSSLYQLIENGKDFMALNVMIQMECCSGLTLREYLDDKDYQVNRKIIFHLFKQLINGLKHIHEEGLIHRDIKPANIFIDKTRMLLKIGDFGLAKKSSFQPQLEQEIKGLKKNTQSLADMNHLNLTNVNQSRDQAEKKRLKASLIGSKQQSAQFSQQFGELNQMVKNKKKEEASICAGTPLYQAPEQTMQQIQISKKANQPIWLTDKVDMFAAGLTLYEMCSNFKTQHQRIQKFYQLKTLRSVCEDTFKNMPEERDIILCLTDPNPKKRFSAVQLLNYKTFQNWSFEVKH